MIGILHSRVLCLMALIAVGELQAIIPIHVAALASRRCMCAFKRKIRCCMIEGRRLPRRYRVASRAIVRKTSFDVIGCDRTREVLLMTLIAIRIGQVVIPGDVTALARLIRMCSLQGELRRRMIEGRRFPCRDRVAGRAVMSKVPENMIGCRCCGEILLMALVTVGVLQIVIPGNVTCLARLNSVRTLEREHRCGMIEG